MLFAALAVLLSVLLFAWLFALLVVFAGRPAAERAQAVARVARSAPTVHIRRKTPVRI